MCQPWRSRTKRLHIRYGVPSSDASRAQKMVFLSDKSMQYGTKNPTGSKEVMVVVVMRALFDLCRSEIEKVNLPSRR